MRRKHPSHRSAPRWLAHVALVALVLANLGLIRYGLGSPDRSRKAVAVSGRWLLVTGAGLSSGAGDRPGETGRLLAPHVDVVSTTGGFTAAEGRAPGDVVAAVRDRTDLPYLDHVVLQGGETDVDAPVLALDLALAHLIDYLRAGTRPTTSLTLVGPIVEQLPASPEVRLVNTAMRNKAATYRIHYIDAVARGITSADPDMPQAVADAVREAAGVPR